jgi:hypothetical protein
MIRMYAEIVDVVTRIMPCYLLHRYPTLYYHTGHDANETTNENRRRKHPKCIKLHIRCRMRQQCNNNRTRRLTNPEMQQKHMTSSMPDSPNEQPMTNSTPDALIALVSS